MRNLIFFLVGFILFLSTLSVYGQTGSILIQSSPRGAKVIVDGRTMGITPYTLKKERNSYNITAEDTTSIGIVSFLMQDFVWVGI